MGNVDGWLAGAQDWVVTLQALVSLFLLPFAGYFFIRNLNQQFKLRGEERYLNLNERWHGFLELTLSHIDTGAADYAVPVDEAAMTADQMVRRDTLFEMLTSIFERAHLLYRERRGSTQWEGWVEYVEFYCGRPDYQRWARRYLLGRTGYDVDFAEFMLRRLDAMEKTPDWVRGADGRWSRVDSV